MLRVLDGLRARAGRRTHYGARAAAAPPRTEPGIKGQPRSAGPERSADCGASALPAGGEPAPKSAEVERVGASLVRPRREGWAGTSSTETSTGGRRHG
jgi:hypothetical protein